MRNYEPGTPILRRAASGLEESLTVEHVAEGQVTFRTSDGKRVVKHCNTGIQLRYALCGYKVVLPATKVAFDRFA